MIRVPTRLRKGWDFLVRSSAQTIGQDFHHSVMASHENTSVSGIIVGFSGRFQRYVFGLSAVQWSPFRPVQSRCNRFIPYRSCSNTFRGKKRALIRPRPRVEIWHTFEREHQHNFDPEAACFSLRLSEPNSVGTGIEQHLNRLKGRLHQGSKRKTALRDQHQ